MYGNSYSNHSLHILFAGLETLNAPITRLSGAVTGTATALTPLSCSSRLNEYSCSLIDSISSNSWVGSQECSDYLIWDDNCTPVISSPVADVVDIAAPMTSPT